MKPFAQTLHEKALEQKCHLNLSFPLEVDELLLIKQRRTAPETENIIENIPSEFWLHRCFAKLPARSSYRKNLCAKLVDAEHKKKCLRLVENPKDFHLESQETCLCKICGRQLEWFHHCI